LSGAKNSSDTIIIHSSVNWEIINESTWLGINKLSGSGNDTIIVHAKSANTWNINRTTGLIFKFISYKNDTAYITQKIPDFLTLDVTNSAIGPVSGSNTTVLVRSNMDWTISHEQDWISTSIDSGSDSVEVIFTALSDNTSGAERHAVFTIANASFSRLLTITQSGNLAVIDSDDEKNIKIYPNPADDYLIINAKDLQINKIQIFDMVGKEIAHYEGYNEVRVNTSAFADGVYTIKFFIDSIKIVNKKFIKQ
jgi:hypothetical protein